MSPHLIAQLGAWPNARWAAAGCIPVFVGPPFHAMPFARHVDYAASSVFINLTDTRKWFGKERAQWHLNPRTQNKHKGKEGGSCFASQAHMLSCLCSGLAGCGLPRHLKLGCEQAHQAI